MTRTGQAGQGMRHSPVRQRGITGLVGAAVLAAGLLACAGPAMAQTSPAAAARWGKAQEVPGTAALTDTLTHGGNGQVNSVSCTAGGNCAAGGSYDNIRGLQQALVVSEVKGRWHDAIGVPGSGGLNAGGSAAISSLSCAQAGDCAATGYYTDKHGHRQGLVALERNGRWANATAVPALAGLNAGGSASVVSVSCPTAGYCLAGGYYTDAGKNRQAFVVSERNGRWAAAIEAPGTATLNTGSGSGIRTLSCASAGNCAAAGRYIDGSGSGQGFVVNESNGKWGSAIEIPGLAALNAGGNADVISLSCARGGICAAGGFYQSSPGIDNETGNYPLQAFVVAEANGAWGSAEEVPGVARLNTGVQAQVSTISCAPKGYCTAAGVFYAGDGPYPGPFVVSDKGGHWGTALVPADSKPVSGEFSEELDSVSCPAAGYCGAGGNYQGLASGAMVLDEKKGHWGTINAVPGAVGGASVVAVSCPSAGDCGAAGDEYSPGLNAFVATEKNGRWSRAMTLPGLKALYHTGKVLVTITGDATVEAVSCSSAGNCSAGGYYANRYAHAPEAFVASERNGRWARAETVPGTLALNAGGSGNAEVTSMSCRSTGNCSAGGFYTARGSGRSGPIREAFVVSETKGVWRSALKLANLLALNAGGSAQVNSVSCHSAGNCVAAGSYTDGNGHLQGFVASEAKGRWGAAEEVPGLGSLNAGGKAAVASVSCGAVGNCAAGGTYDDGTGRSYGFLVNEVSGRWGVAEKLHFFLLQGNGNTGITSVSCPSAGNCTAGGFYVDPSGDQQAVQIEELSGRWRGGAELGGGASLNAGGHSEITSVSCYAPADCSVGGTYTDSSGRTQAFVAFEKNLDWGFAGEVKGLGSLNAGGAATLTAVSCAARANCAAGGSYTDGNGHVQAYVVSETNGTWGKAQEVPGTAALNADGDSAVASVSCPAPGRCTAGGFYTDRTKHYQAFVVSGS
jgi:hypothetical protein